MSAASITHSRISKGFWLAGAYNVGGVLSFSQFFQNDLLFSNDPLVFSWVGLAAIILWGLAYAAVAQSYRAVPYLVLLFFLEKMLYVVTWLLWLAEHGERWPELFVLSPLTAVFFAVYGAGDLLFGLFFLWVGVGTLRGTLK